MAKCKDCIHREICDMFAHTRTLICTDRADKMCKMFKPTADVVPKSEVVKALNEVELLIIITKETYKQQMEDAPNELSKQPKRTKWIAFEKFYEQFAELKKKHTEDKE